MVRDDAIEGQIVRKPRSLSLFIIQKLCCSGSCTVVEPVEHRLPDLMTTANAAHHRTAPTQSLPSRPRVVSRQAVVEIVYEQTKEACKQDVTAREP